jgi:hypothetical protein
MFGAPYLAELKQITKLSLAGSGTTDASLKHLRSLVGLRDLDLSRTGVSPEGVTALKKDLPMCTIRVEAGENR